MRRGRDVTRLVYMPGVCRDCGCDDEHACVDEETGEPCSWVEPDLCSMCAAEVIYDELEDVEGIR